MIAYFLSASLGFLLVVVLPTWLLMLALDRLHKRIADGARRPKPTRPAPLCTIPERCPACGDRGWHQEYCPRLRRTRGAA